jgi:hypothetical protein
MEPCALCGAPTSSAGLGRVSGLDFCEVCRTCDPTAGLVALGVAVEWNTQLMRFSAGLGVPYQDPGFALKCVPELWAHKVAKLGLQEVEVGDPAFDSRIFVRTNDPEQARAVLASEGVQSALLALLTGVRTNELVGNHVTLEGPTLLVSTRPLGGLSDDEIQELRLETTALALHLRSRRA